MNQRTYRKIADWVKLHPYATVREISAATKSSPNSVIDVIHKIFPEPETKSNNCFDIVYENAKKLYQYQNSTIKRLAREILDAINK